MATFKGSKYCSDFNAHTYKLSSTKLSSIRIPSTYMKDKSEPSDIHEIYVTGPTKIDHVSANYTEFYFR